MSRLEELIAELCPDGVEFHQMGKVCRLVTGATPSKTNPAFWIDGTIPWMSSGEVNNKRVFDTESKITKLGYDKTSTTIVPIHTVVIALAGQGKTRGKVAITEIELCTNQSLCSIICGPELDYKFLYYYLDGKYEELRTISNGDGTRGGLSLKILSPYKIPVPPLPVQSEIVKILDNFTELTAQLQLELSARKRQYEYYRDKLLTFDVLEGGASECVWRTLGEIADVFRGEYITKKSTKPGNIPVILGGQEPAYYIDKSNHDGEVVVIARSGVSAGFVSYWNEPIFITDGFGYEAKKNITTPKFLYYILKNKEAELNAMKRGAGVPHVSGEALGQVLLPIPPLKEQERIISILDRFDALCNDLTSGLPAEIAARQKQYEYYRDKLLTFRPLSQP